MKTYAVIIPVVTDGHPQSFYAVVSAEGPQAAAREALHRAHRETRGHYTRELLVGDAMVTEGDPTFLLLNPRD